MFDKEVYPVLAGYTNPVKKPERDIVGRKEEMRSMRAALMRPELCNILLLGDAGSGKALRDDVMIPVADSRGMVPIGNIKPGDYVFDESGKPCPVLGVFHQGLMHVYDVLFDDGSVIPCNDSHLWATWCGRGRNSVITNFRVQALKDMDVPERVTGNIKYYVPRAQAAMRSARSLPLPAYAMGVFLACGTQSFRGFCLTCSDNAVWSALYWQLGSALYRWLEPSHDEWFIVLDGVSNISAICDGECAEVLNKPIAERHIPSLYLYSSADQRRQLLCGLLGLAPDVKDNKIIKAAFSTISEKLAHDVRILAASLGFRPVIYPPEVEGQAYDVNFNRPGCPGITGVIDTGTEAEMTCLYVNSPNHLFQCGEGHIVTHNTMLVQGTMMSDSDRDYLEVNLSKMVSDKGVVALPGMLETLFSEVVALRQDTGREIVLFIDEFHRIVEVSPAAVEALKPLLADSGTRGIKVIAATTYIEFQKWISPNQPLVERLQRININQPGREMTIEILKGMAKRYGIDDKIKDDAIYDTIYEYTERYVPANSQPRKSILLLDNMVGWYRAENRAVNKTLLADVIFQQEGINVAFRVDAANIKAEIDKKVFAQEMATSIIQDRLQLCVADLNDKSKPMSSFLFCGSTGVGKALPDDMLIPVYDEFGKISHKKNGYLRVGDYVFSREGKPEVVTGVFPQGVQDECEVTFDDGRVLPVNERHLWSYRIKGSDTYYVADTLMLMAVMQSGHKIEIPMNGAVQWPEQDYSLSPYVLGAAISAGQLSESIFELNVCDEFIADKCANLLCSPGADYVQDKRVYRILLPKGKQSGEHKYFSTYEVMIYTPELMHVAPEDMFLPDAYKYGSVEQRLALINGLFDCGSHIRLEPMVGYEICYRSKSVGLLRDIQDVLYSLGIYNVLYENGRDTSKDAEIVIPCDSIDKQKLFLLDRKRRVIEQVMNCIDSRDVHVIDSVGIKDITRTGKRKPMTCIMVDDPEHLYQAGQFIVTHNTEVCKQLAQVLFEDSTRLVRFDMSEYANADSMNRFRYELTAKVWARPYCVLLLDEIEKSCSEVTKLLLQVLDDGRLLDENNREVVFTNCYIVLTTNAGSEIYKSIAQYAVDDKGSGQSMAKYDKVIRRSLVETSNGKFPPELLGRVNCVVPFQPLSQATMYKIVHSKLQKMKGDVMSKHGVDVMVHAKVEKYLVEDKLDTDSDSGGARGVIAKLESEVTTEVARFINSNPGCRRAFVWIQGELASENKNKLQSDAMVRVTAKPIVQASQAGR